MINNMVKQMLVQKQAHFEQRMSNPRMFVQQMLETKSAFQTQLEEENKASMKQATSSYSGQSGFSIEQNDLVRRLQQANSGSYIEIKDNWNLENTYHIQPIQAKNKGKYMDIIQQMSAKYGVPTSLIQKMIETESNFNPNIVSHAGAMGLMQLMPANVKEQGITNAFDARQNIEGGVSEISRYLKRYNGDLVLSLAAYNAGPGNVKKYGGVPPFKETEGYIKKILNINVR